MSHAAVAPTSRRRSAVDDRMSGSSSVEASCRLGVAHERESPAAFVEPAIERGVGHGLGGDLGEALQELHARKLAGMVVEQGHQAHDLAAHHQGQVDAGALTGGRVAGTLGRAQVRVERDIVDRDGLMDGDGARCHGAGAQ